MTDSAEFLKLATNKDVDLDLDNLDELLSQLTAEELDELNGDFDPDNSFLPPSERMKSQTDKKPTGPFSRKQLLAFLEKKAKEEKDWENVAQYVKKVPGESVDVSEKTWKPKVVPKTKEEEEIDTEWDDILKQATEDELVDLAAVLGFHGMLNQTQFYASERDEKLESGGFTGVAKPEKLKVIPLEPPNQTDVEESIKRINDNDSSLKHLNLNNIKNISHERLEAVCEGLKTNTNLEILEMASVAMTELLRNERNGRYESHEWRHGPNGNESDGPDVSDVSRAHRWPITYDWKCSEAGLVMFSSTDNLPGTLALVWKNNRCKRVYKVFMQYVERLTQPTQLGSSQIQHQPRTTFPLLQIT